MTLKQLEQQSNEEVRVVLETTKGNITLRLFPDIAPKAVANFLGLAKQGYYDGVIFHRVISDFMIQGGDPTGTGSGGQSIYGSAFEDEFSMDVFHFNGALSMANSGPNTNGSQFFIVTATQVPSTMLRQLEQGGWPQNAIEEYAKNGGTPWLDHKHTVFGQVVEGMDVVQMIEQSPVGPADKPVEDIKILSVKEVKSDD